MTRRLVTTTYLEMADPADLSPARDPEIPLDVTRVEIPSPELSRFLYACVGAQWSWHNRLSWDREQWLRYLDRPELEMWLASVRGTPAGYFELERQQAAVQIVYFGLLPSFLDKGLGGPLLTAALERAWQMGASRVWVHTCDLDHPHALANYQARGLRIYRVEEREENVPAVMRQWDGQPVLP